MYFSRNALLALCTLVGPIVPALSKSQVESAPWSHEQVLAAIAGCRASFLDKLVRGYLSSRNLTADQLPPHFAERITPTIEPLLLSCDCSIIILAKEIPLDRFQMTAPTVQQRLNDLVSKGGVCEPKVGT